MIFSGELVYGVIYLITHIDSGKKYAGQTTDWEQRYRCYRTYHCAGQRKLYNALKHHGVDAFKFEVIHVAYDQVQLDWLEQWFIEFYDTIANGYNLTAGGNGRGIASAETKKLMSEVQLKRHQDPAVIAQKRASALAQSARNKVDPVYQAKKAARKLERDQKKQRQQDEAKAQKERQKVEAQTRRRFELLSVFNAATQPILAEANQILEQANRLRKDIDKHNSVILPDNPVQYLTYELHCPDVKALEDSAQQQLVEVDRARSTILRRVRRKKNLSPWDAREYPLKIIALLQNSWNKRIQSTQERQTA